MNRPVLCLLGILALTSCSKTLFSTDPNKFNLNNVAYEYLTLKSKVQYEDENTSHKGIANIRIKKDSIVWFSITPGMGIEAARGVILEDSVKIINKIEKEYSVESIDKLLDKVHFDFDLSMVESILIGNLIWPIKAEDEINRIKGYFVFTKHYQNLTITNYIGTHSKKVEKLEAKSDSTTNTLNIQYSDFKKESGKIIPSKIDVQIKYNTKTDNIQKMSNITIEHAKVEIDKNNLKFSFSIPKKYTRR